MTGPASRGTFLKSKTGDINMRKGTKSETSIVETRKIRIINGSYKLQFEIEDGGSIMADGSIYQLHYLDQTHFAVGSPRGRCWHICEFGEKVIDRGVEVKPA
jgi:hypothetical protein